MKKFWMVAFLTLIWCSFSNHFALPNILLGVLVSLLVCNLVPSRGASYHIRLWPLCHLLLFILYELLISSVIVAWDVVTPRHRSDPIVIEVELACQHDTERTLLANLLSLTPGTLSIDLSEDKSKLKVHVMFGSSPGGVVDFIQKRLEPKVLKVFRYA